MVLSGPRFRSAMGIALAGIAALATVPVAFAAPSASTSGNASAEVVVPVEIHYSLNPADADKRQVRSICRPNLGPCPIYSDQLVVVLRDDPPRSQQRRPAREVPVQVYFE